MGCILALTIGNVHIENQFIGLTVFNVHKVCVTRQAGNWVWLPQDAYKPINEILDVPI